MSQTLESLFLDVQLFKFEAGEAIAIPDEFTKNIYRIREGSLRLLYMSAEKKGVLTLSKLSAGDYVGISNVLHAEPCERVSAAEFSVLEGIPSDAFVKKLLADQSLLNEAINLQHPFLGIQASKSYLDTNHSPSTLTDELINKIALQGKLCSAEDLDAIDFSKNLSISANSAYKERGILITDKNIDSDLLNSFSNIPPLVWTFPKEFLTASKSTTANNYSNKSNKDTKSIDKLYSTKDSVNSPDAYLLGLRNYHESQLNERFPEKYASNRADATLAIFEMTALRFNIMFRKDILRKRLNSMTRSKRELDTTSLAKLCIATGLDARPANVDGNKIRKVIPPFIALKESQPILVHSIEGKNIIFGDGFSKLAVDEIHNIFSPNAKVDFIQIKRRVASAKDIFNWGWVWTIVRNYKKSLLLVVVISLMAQLFALGTPLLLQQLIDKVLTQGNVSSLNILAGLMIIFALFQSILKALRTFLFVDTTDRIDLTLGSSIIDRLFKLPLGFFEKRPVGELSQRIGEMNTIRGFLTGTVITTFLDLIFSSLYFIVMLTYSAGLTAVALSTFPFYLLITIVAAPIYREQLRARAVAQAQTQAHLIETLGGIQTVKAQHGELRARWKWQKRYQRFVEEGYRSVILGTTTAQIGSFLNTLSGLLILWFGLRMVLDGNLTLGQLLAFRIFAGYVTQPLLRISGLWQGMQKVNLSMERLADIVNQETEGGELDDEQIALAPISGDVSFENLDFSFNSGKTLQLENVNLQFNHGEFIGVVGLSGSGKSTLMKLLARLYPPQKGRILIDDTDISKVQLSSLRSQIGLVPQDGILFEGSVSENIALNDPTINQDSIVDAAKSACAHEFIMELPQGYATRVSEKGSNFSGGQRQRIAIARMLIESPSLLIMDEATSALDADTEKKVCRNLKNKLNGKTVFFVTHRMATIMKADRVVVMDKGNVAELGTPDELIKQRGIFAALWQQQR
nr:ABC transporter transmembrane domain-containing protein [Synechococcus sp. AH-551-A10]